MYKNKEKSNNKSRIEQLLRRLQFQLEAFSSLFNVIYIHEAVSL